ncbi:MAG TPA: SOS response-associated peptidase family protein [Edaphobacter sp.]|nr:SOS response-associated peptidase family protein [Edaphobacter sp.]
MPILKRTLCDDTVIRGLRGRFGLRGRPINSQHRLSSRTPTGTELKSIQLTQSANRNPLESNELMQPIHDRMTTFLEPQDYEEYLAPSERPPVHLLRILPSSKMKVQLVDATPISNQQVSLFDSQ